jgi:hypothetical protein
VIGMVDVIVAMEALSWSSRTYREGDSSAKLWFRDAATSLGAMLKKSLSQKYYRSNKIRGD